MFKICWIATWERAKKRGSAQVSVCMCHIFISMWFEDLAIWAKLMNRVLKQVYIVQLIQLRSLTLLRILSEYYSHESNQATKRWRSHGCQFWWYYYDSVMWRITRWKFILTLITNSSLERTESSSSGTLASSTNYILLSHGVMRLNKILNIMFIFM